MQQKIMILLLMSFVFFKNTYSQTEIGSQTSNTYDIKTDIILKDANDIVILRTVAIKTIGKVTLDRSINTLILVNTTIEAKDIDLSQVKNLFIAGNVNLKCQETLTFLDNLPLIGILPGSTLNLTYKQNGFDNYQIPPNSNLSVSITKIK